MKIIYYEGLSINPFTLFSANYIEKYLLKKIKKEFENVEFERRHWLSRKKISDKEVLVIGHSFGGAAAIRNTVLCHALITLDVRDGFNSEYRLNNREIKCYNFYQLIGLRGYPVIGSKIEEKINFTSHTELPDEDIVWRFIDHILYKKGIR